MGFSPTIKADALTLSARHCCVCHRYKGLKIEVHHIIQEADGGPNTLDNAIALCFDCHADAGHYNDNHPKGTKFSKPELRKAKDAWFAIVKEHKILAPENTSDHLHFRHMILRDLTTATEIFSGNLKEFPYPSTMLLRNEIFDFVNSLAKKNKYSYQTLSIDFKTFQTKDEVLKSYDDIKIVDKSDTEHPYFYATRVPSKEELRGICEQMDPFVRHMFGHDIDPSIYSLAMIYEVSGGCGSMDDTTYYQEFISFKSFWYSFLAITNTSDRNIELLELEGTQQENSSLVLNVKDSSKESEFKFKFPKIKLLPNDTVLLPTAVILVPFDEEYFNETNVHQSDMSDMRSQILTHLIRDPQEQTGYCVLGKYLKPTNITYNPSDRVVHSEMHALDLNNFFILDQFWAMGSCPHLFYLRNNRLEYVRELFTEKPGVESEEELRIPTGVSKIVIAELEQETTYLNKVCCNDFTKDNEIVLRPGQSYHLDVKENDSLKLSGYYIPFSNEDKEQNKMFVRNRLISNYLRHYNSSSFA